MSFRDDAIEPLAIESAEHFAQLLKHAADRRENAGFVEERRERVDARRALPRELGS